MSETSQLEKEQLQPDAEATSVKESNAEIQPASGKKELLSEHFGRPVYQFNDIISTHHLSLFALFSVLVVLSGAALVGLALKGLSIPDPLSAVGFIFANPFLFLTAGLLLVISPFYIDRFILHAVRHERELRVRAQNSTREARLLQDILTHDIRNYNQVMIGYANLIGDEGKGNAEIENIVSRIESAVEKSTDFVDRAKLLGKIISDQDYVIRRTDLLTSVQRSIELTRKANPGREIIVVAKIESSPAAPVEAVDRGKHDPTVAADDLLDEVFANLFSNSVKYTKADQVFIAIELQKQYDKALKKKCWKLSVTDTGEGIPDNMKDNLFSRYTKGSKEAGGLGMSIVHALVSGRYKGRIQVKDRVENDYSKGSSIEIWLPAA